MPTPDPAELARQLRDNLKRRKSQQRELTDSGADEEGDVFAPGDPHQHGAWVREGSKKL